MFTNKLCGSQLLLAARFCGLINQIFAKENLRFSSDFRVKVLWSVRLCVTLQNDGTYFCPVVGNQLIDR